MHKKSVLNFLQKSHKSILGIAMVVGIFSFIQNHVVFAADIISIADTSSSTDSYIPLMKLDPSGNPLILYRKGGASPGIYIMDCDDPDCAAGGNTTTRVFTPVSSFSSPSHLELDSNDNAIAISGEYNPPTTDKIMYTQCTNSSCTTFNTVDISPVPAITGSNLRERSLALSSTDIPYVAYLTNETGSGALNLAICSNPACGSVSHTQLVASGAKGFVDIFLENVTEYPVITYMTSGGLQIMHCNDVLCAGNNETIIGIDPLVTAATGQKGRMVKHPTTGAPVIVYSRSPVSGPLYVAVCSDTDCSTSSTNALSGTTYWSFASVDVDAAGYPVIAYYDANTPRDLVIIHCNDAFCGGNNETSSRPDTANNTGYGASIQLDALGYPVVAYTNFTLLQLRVLHCDDANCLQPAVNLSQTTLATAEGAPGPATYTAVLTQAPAQDVAVTFTASAQCSISSSDARFLGGIGTFSSLNYSTPMTLQVTAIDDGVAEETHSCTITHSVASADLSYNGISVATVNVTITDNDFVGISVNLPMNVGATNYILGGAAEAGPDVTYSVVLNSQPSSNVNIVLSAGGQISAITPSTLTFTPSGPIATRWNTPHIVTVTALQDPISELSPHQETITTTDVQSTDTNYDVLTVLPVVVDITDDDPPGVTICSVATCASSVFVNETLPSFDTYSIVLLSQPTADVTVNIVDPGNDTTTNVASRTFTSGNWATSQTVEVTAIDDGAIEGPHTEVITHTITSLDAGYAALSLADITAQITDNDGAGVTLTPGNLDLEENGTTGSYDIILNTAPGNGGSDVYINAYDPTGQCTVSISPILLDNVNYAAGATIDVTAVDDVLVEGPHTCTIQHTINPATTDTDYGALAGVVGTITFTIDDNDTEEPPEPRASITGNALRRIFNNVTKKIVRSITCPYFTQYLRPGYRDGVNGITEVHKLQQFLIDKSYLVSAITGFFGPVTTGAVRAWQADHAQDVLNPWRAFMKPTGLFLQLSKRMANIQVGCPAEKVVLPNGMIVE